MWLRHEARTAVPTFADLAPTVVNFPQVLFERLRVKAKRDLSGCPACRAAIARVGRRASGQGRLLIRLFGALNLCYASIARRPARARKSGLGQ